VPYIIGEIKRFLRDDGLIKVSRSLKELSVKIVEAKKEEIAKTGEELSVCKLAEKLQVQKEEIAMAIDSIRPIESIDMAVYEGEGANESRISRIDIKKDEMSLLVDRLCISELMDELNEQDRKIILLRYYSQKTQTEVAKILGTSQVQISRREKRILALMRDKIEV